MIRFCAAIMTIFACSPVWADAKITVLMDVMQIEDVVDILKEEGLQYGATLDAEMLDGQGGAFWAEQVRRLYDPQRMEAELRRAFSEELSDADVASSIDFYASDTGTRIIESENRTRRALSDPDIAAAADDLVAQLRSEDAPVLALTEKFIEVNDLIGNNVAGAMSQHYHFLKGLTDGGYAARTEDELLDDVWQRRDAITADTEIWMTSFLTLAFVSLSQDELESYVDFSQSEAGRALNSALFVGFEAIYKDISYGLGRAIALNATTDEI